MSIYRPVCTYVWNDDKFPFLSDDAQLVWFHIFTHPASTPLGLLRTSLEGLAADKDRNRGKWTMKRYRESFTELARNDFVNHCEEHLVIGFPKFFRTDRQPNHPRNPNVLRYWGKVYDEFPSCHLKDHVYQSLKLLLESFKESFRQSFTKSFEACSPPVTVTGTVTVTPPLSLSLSDNHDCRKKEKSRRVMVDLPTDWHFTDRHKIIAEGLGVNVHREAVKFKDRCIAKGLQYKDWDAAFRMWLTKAQEFKEARP